MLCFASVIAFPSCFKSSFSKSAVDMYGRLCTYKPRHGVWSIIHYGDSPVEQTLQKVPAVPSPSAPYTKLAQRANKPAIRIAYLECRCVSKHERCESDTKLPRNDDHKPIPL